MIGWRPTEDAYQITGANGSVSWRDSAGGSLLTASISPGDYNDYEISSLLKRAMEAISGASYAVWRDGDSEKFYFQQLDPASGTWQLIIGPSSILGELGYTSSKFGALIYPADLPTPAMLYFEFTLPAQNPEFTPDLNQRDSWRAYSGKQRSHAPMELIKRYEVDWRLQSYAELDSFMDFHWWSIYGRPFRYWPDKLELSRWVMVTDENKNSPYREQLPLLNHWNYRPTLEEVGDNPGTIGLEECQDR